MTDIKTESIRLRVTKDQKDRAEALAAACNISVSELIIRLLELAETKPIVSYEVVLS